MLEPVPQYGSFDERTNDQNKDLFARPARYGEFPDSEQPATLPVTPSGATAGARAGRLRSPSVQTGQLTGDSVLAAVEDTENELLIEDTSTAARRVKG